MADQVKTMKLVLLKAPGTKRLKTKYDQSVSKFAFIFNLRSYNMARGNYRSLPAWTLAGAYARSQFSST